MKTFILTLSVFLALAYYSQQEHGYTRTERENMERLIASVQYDDSWQSKMVYLYNDQGEVKWK